ncbi:MAG: cation transporter, partial [Thiohalocapsa sp.]
MSKIDLKIHGMDCAEEVGTIRHAIGRDAGVNDLEFDLLNGRLTVEYDQRQIDTDELIAKINRTGLRAERYSDENNQVEERGFWARWGPALMTTVSAVFLIGGLIAHVLMDGLFAAIAGEEGGDVPWVVRGLYLGAAVSGAWFV